MKKLSRILVCGGICLALLLSPGSDLSRGAYVRGDNSLTDATVQSYEQQLAELSRARRILSRRSRQWSATVRCPDSIPRSRRSFPSPPGNIGARKRTFFPAGAQRRRSFSDILPCQAHFSDTGPSCAQTWRMGVLSFLPIRGKMMVKGWHNCRHHSK